MVYDFIQNVAINHGSHALKFGAEYKPVSLPIYQPAVPHGGMTFNHNFTNNPQAAYSALTGDSIASFLLGHRPGFLFPRAILLIKGITPWHSMARMTGR